MRITFATNTFECRPNENLLDAFFRNKIEVPFSCRNGTCQACLIQSVSGEIPKNSQIGLSKELVKTQHLLPCKCFPVSDMVLRPPSIENIYQKADIVQLEKLSEKVMKLVIKPQDGFNSYKAGQFINIRTALDDKVRSYSIANRCDNSQLHLHVQNIENGIFSSWIFADANKQDSIDIHYPLGACYHSGDLSCEGKLILATGSGLGASLAIAQEALSEGYSGEIKLFHSCKTESEFYAHQTLESLKKNYRNFSYHQSCYNEKPLNPETCFNTLDQIAFNTTLKNWEVYLYGNPSMVKSCIQQAKAKDCCQESIYYDAFEYAQQNTASDKQNSMEFVEELKPSYIPDPLMWQALDDGKKLNAILNDFYDKVLQDPLLSPFFKGVTKQHIVGKQYAFLNQIYTGKDCYFGDRPRNAHHWMIISNELFDYREKLFKESCIKYGLKEPFLSQILEFDESFREAIVKTRVWPRITDGEIKAIKGFDEMIVDIGCLCDSCEKVLDKGDKVHYHDRTGEIYCQDCQNT